MSWSADSLDHVVFLPPVQGGVPDALQPWLRIFRVPPRSYQGPIPGVGQSPVAHAFGPVGDYNVTIISHLGRLELKLSGIAPTVTGQPGSVPFGGATPVVIEDVLSAIALLKSYAEPLLGGANAARVALVLNLSRAEVSAQAAVQSFQSSLPISGALPQEATDLSFVINLGTRVTLSDSTIASVNRLCRWSVARRQMMMVTINGAGGAAIPSMEVRESFASTLQVDINSTPAPAGGHIATWTPALSYEMFEKLEALAMPILERGYVGLIGT